MRGLLGEGLGGLRRVATLILVSGVLFAAPVAASADELVVDEAETEAIEVLDAAEGREDDVPDARTSDSAEAIEVLDGAKASEGDSVDVAVSEESEPIESFVPDVEDPVVGEAKASASLAGAVTSQEVQFRYGVDNGRARSLGITPASDFVVGDAEDGTAAIWYYEGDSPTVVVPSVIDGRTVTVIGKDVFSHRPSLTEVYLPDTVTAIETMSFDGCTSLRCLNLGGLKGALVPYGGGLWGLLWDCTSLERLTMADGASFSIEPVDGGGNNFSILRENVLDNIRYIYLGSSMRDVPKNLFYGDSLERVDVGAGNAQYASAGGVVYDATKKTLLVMGTGYTGDHAVPTTCTAISGSALQYCAGLRRIAIPQSVRTIDGAAFSDAHPTIVTTRGSYADTFGRSLGLKVEYGSLPDLSRDGWVDLPGGGKGYARGGALFKGWMDLGSSKYWFDGEGRMATGWTDVVVGGNTMHYYFNPASGNLVRGTWFTIEGRQCYFRPSGNLATGWATISDNSVDKKYYFESDGTLVSGCWRDIDTGQGYVGRYYFRPSGAMATGWATIDGEKYWFRPSGNMATGWADADDAYKRYFDQNGRMLTGWQQIGGKRYYFRASGAMQTGIATIDGKRYSFTDNGVLVG